MLFILALQHQRNQTLHKENQHWQTQLFKETFQNQSNLLRESLREEIRQMKRIIRRQERMNDSDNDIDIENLFENQNNINEINDEEDIFHLDNDIELNNNRNNHIHAHTHINHHHKRRKSKGINNLYLLEESKINDETLIKTDIQNCSICLENYKRGDKITYLPCFHLYHSKCIKKWLKCSKKCPLCKKEVNLKII